MTALASYVSASGCAHAVVLVRGVGEFDKSVPTATVTRKPGTTEPQDLVWDLAMLGRSWRLHFLDAVGLPLLLSADSGTHELRNWKQEAEHFAEPGSKRHDWGFAGSVEILWAGDLNGDRELDILLKQGDAEIGSSVELYLSDSSTGRPVLADRFSYGAC